MIPEWKRGAVVLVTSDDLLLEKPSIFEVASKKLRKHVRNTELYKSYRESNIYKEIQDFKDDLKQSSKNLKEGIEASQNPLIMMSRDLVDRVSFKSSSAEATRIMRKYDPNFNLLDFEKEVDVIFKLI